MKKSKKQAFSIVEMLIVLSILSVIFIGIITASLQIAKNIDKTRKLVTARNEIAVFCQSMYVFSNKSYGAYFTDSLGNSFDYLDTYAAYHNDPAQKSNYNTLIFEKNSTNTLTGQLIYNPDTHEISWVKANGAEPETMLTEVYPPDYNNNSDKGSSPIFKLPHLRTLYDVTPSPDRPKFIVIEFTKVIEATNATNTNQITIPVKLMIQIGIVK